MIYLYAYLGLGLLVLGLVYLFRDTPEQRAQNPMNALSEGGRSAYRTTGDWFIESILGPVIALSLIVIGWPFMGYYRLKERVLGKHSTALAPDPVFAVEKAHLLDQVSVEEVEALETVFDPLGAAPNVPFGHLNAAWRAFIEGGTECDELWSFSADWQTAWGNRERRAGYVRIREGEPGDYFMTMWKDLPDGARGSRRGEPGVSKYIAAWVSKFAD